MLDDHLNIANNWVGEPFERILDEDLGASSLKTLSSSSTMASFAVTRVYGNLPGGSPRSCRSIEHSSTPTLLQTERVALLEWTYEDAEVRVRDGVDTYLLEDGKIVAQTIHYTVETKWPPIGQVAPPAAFSRDRLHARTDRE